MHLWDVGAVDCNSFGLLPCGWQVDEDGPEESTGDQGRDCIACSHTLLYLYSNVLSSGNEICFARGAGWFVLFSWYFGKYH